MIQHRNKLAMPCGSELWLDRPRSHGTLSAEELSFCRTERIPLAFDTLQSGWVPAQVEDDLSPDIPAWNEVADMSHPRVTQAKPKPSLHLHLRAWGQSDLPRYIGLLDDPLVWADMYEPYPDPLTPDMAAGLIEMSNTSNHHQVHAVLLDDTPIGQVRLLFDCDVSDPSVAEISYWFGREFWGRGLASVVVKAFAGQSLAENPGLSALVAGVKFGNTASRRVLEKAGFQVQPSGSRPGWHILRKNR